MLSLTGSSSKAKRGGSRVDVSVGQVNHRTPRTDPKNGVSFLFVCLFWPMSNEILNNSLTTSHSSQRLRKVVFGKNMPCGWWWLPWRTTSISPPSSPCWLLHAPVTTQHTLFALFSANNSGRFSRRGREVKGMQNCTPMQLPFSHRRFHYIFGSKKFV